jgi:hypothetical protein
MKFSLINTIFKEIEKLSLEEIYYILSKAKHLNGSYVVAVAIELESRKAR